MFTCDLREINASDTSARNREAEGQAVTGKQFPFATLF
jgi:hypothetical protein